MLESEAVRPLLLIMPLLVASACSSSAPGAPTSVSGDGGTAAAASTASFGMVGFVTVVGTPAPVVLTAQVAGASAVPVDGNGRFELPAVPATATALTLRFDGRETTVRFPMSPLTGPSLLLEVRLDAASGTAVVSRLCSTSTMTVGTPGAAVVSMCVAFAGA